MSELLMFPLFGLWLYYAYVTSDAFRTFVRTKRKLKWLKRWMTKGAGR